MRRTLLYKSVLIAVFVFLRTVGSDAQEAIIKGSVEGRSGPLPLATVSVADKFVLTDRHGKFSLALAAGVYTFVITHSGYKTIAKEIKIEASSERHIDFTLTTIEEMGEIVVVGSRSRIQRSNLNTPVPVDVFSSKALIQTAQTSLTQMLSFSAPSFNASRQVFNEPVTLRGLDPDHVLILVNGIRYHTMAWLNQGNLKGQLGRGSVGNDINSIPFSSIEKVEILRDGASAQYGSDAIAGVINIRLKESTGKTFINVHAGQFYKGDGEKILVGINRGISLNNKGFLNFSGDFRYQAPTYRGGNYEGPVYYNVPGNSTPDQVDSIVVLDNLKIKERNFNRKDAVSNVGISKLTNSGVLMNGKYRIHSNIQLFWTGAVNHRIIHYEGAYRFAKDRNQVNTALHPNGFKAIIKTVTDDVSGKVGLEGETKNNWHWSLASVFGKNSVDNFVDNTNNASQIAMGKNAPTTFYVGKLVFNQLNNNISFAKDFSHGNSRPNLFNLAFGAEWRLENYQRIAGEEASWKNYDSSGKTQGGSQSFAGYNPENEVNKSRNVLGAYIDLETEFNNHFLFDIAGRYEYYDDFGSNLAGKLSVRYKFSDRFSLRGSISNGYRAPSIQQVYSGSTTTRWSNSGIPVLRGTFPNNHKVTKAFGIPPLEPEKAINIGGGIMSKISQQISLTIDAYWIEIKNRVVLTGLFEKSIPIVANILVNHPDIDQVQFFTNAINTRTRGIDVVLAGNWNINKTNLGLSLAANLTQTNIFGSVKTSDVLPADSLNTNTLFNIEERTKLEKGQPSDKVILSISWTKGKTGLILRNTHFGKTSTAAIFTNPGRTLPEFFSSKIITDIGLNYALKPWLNLTLGCNNIFDVYPDKLRNYENTVNGTLLYSNEASPFGFNGGYYFVAMSFKF